MAYSYNDIGSTSLNRSFIVEQKNLTLEERNVALSIFDSLDNNEQDSNKDKGIISGNSIKLFYDRLTKECKSAIGKLVTLYEIKENDEKVGEYTRIEQFKGKGWLKTGLERNGDLGCQEIYERDEGDKIIRTYIFRSTPDDNKDGVLDDNDSVRTEKVVIFEVNKSNPKEEKYIESYHRRTDTLSMTYQNKDVIISGRDVDNNGVLEGDEILTYEDKNNPENSYYNKGNWKWGPKK